MSAKMVKKLKQRSFRPYHITLIAVLAVGITIYLPFSSAQSTNPFSHLVDTQWFNFNDGYTSVEVDITPQVGDTDSYYFSNTVYIKNCSTECYAYAGLQTNGYDDTNWIGKMAIFSWWNATNSIPESYGKAVAFGGEGVGQSVRIPYQWQTGTAYRLKIYLDTDGVSKLWGASLTNLSTNQTTRIGRIYAPANYGLIYGPITFHERYGGPQATCKTVPPSQVRFSNMTANNGSIKASSWSHYYKASLPGCDEYFWTQEDANGYVSSLGIQKPAEAQPAKTPGTSSAPSTQSPAQETPEQSAETLNPQEIIEISDNVQPAVQNQPVLWMWKYIVACVIVAAATALGFAAYRKFRRP